MSDRTIIAVVAVGCFFALVLVALVLFARRDVHASFSFRFGVRKVETSFDIEQKSGPDSVPPES